MNQFNAAAINISAIIMPAASQLQPNIKTDSNTNFIELISNIVSTEMSAEKGETAAFINSNPAVKTALYQAVSAMHLSNETAAVAASTPELLESNPVIRQAANLNNLNPEEKQIFIKAVIYTAEIISVKAVELKNNPVQNLNTLTAPAADTFKGASNTAEPRAVQIPILQSNQYTAASAPTPAVIETIPVVPQAQAVSPAIIPASPGAAVTESYAVSSPAVSAVSPIPAASIVNVAARQGNSVQAVSADVKAPVDFSKLEMLVQDLKEAVKVFLDARLGLFNESESASAKMKEDIKVKTEELNIQITQLKEIMNDQSKTAEISKLTAEIASGIAALFYAVDKAAQALNQDSVTGVKAISSNPSTGAGLNEIMSSIRRIEVAISNNPDSSGRNVYAKEVETGLKEIIARIFMLLKDMNGKAEVIRTTEYVNAPNASFTMRVTQDGKVIINTAADKYTAEAKPAAQGTLQAAAKGPEVQITAQVSAAGAQKDIILPGAVPAVSAPADNQAKAPAVFQTPAYMPAQAAPQAAAPVVYAGTDAYYNPETLAKNNSKELSQIFGAISDALTVLKSKESIQVPADAKVFERAADAAGRVKENIVIRQVVQNIQNAVDTVKTTEVKMFLRPENLGSVSIRLEAVDNTITGKIQTASAEVRDILKAALPELRITLQNMGINANSLEITLMNNSGQNSFNGNPAGNSYKEWEGGVLKISSEETDVTEYAGLNGYLNFLA